MKINFKKIDSHKKQKNKHLKLAINSKLKFLLYLYEVQLGHASLLWKSKMFVQVIYCTYYLSNVYRSIFIRNKHFILSMSIYYKNAKKKKVTKMFCTSKFQGLKVRYLAIVNQYYQCVWGSVAIYILTWYQKYESFLSVYSVILEII